MKHYNIKNEATINSKLSVIDKNRAKAGEINIHEEIVTSISFFYPIRDPKTNAILHYHKIDLDRDMVMDLANQISKIESTVHDLPYEPDLPF